MSSGIEFAEFAAAFSGSLNHLLLLKHRFDDASSKQNSSDQHMNDLVNTSLFYQIIVQIAYFNSFTILKVFVILLKQLA
jgi:hypothetical protein